MYKYDGLVVHQSHDDEGIIEVVDSDGVRALHFGSHARQSSMLIAEPDRLHSLYARAMMAGLLFQPPPEDVLMIGLGGGTIAKFLLHQFADCKVRAVEFRGSVLKVARSHFELPFDARLKIKIGCGAHHVKQFAREHSEFHDLIMIDAYDHDGMAPEVSSEAFFDACRTLLTRDGLLVINLWGTDKPLFQQVSWNLGRVFNWRMLFLPVRGRGNIIGFAFADQAAKPTLKSLIDRAKHLEQRYQIEFPTYLLDLKRHNPNVFNRIIKP
ncbi:spermine synthase [Methylomonas sp. CM2]|uniref:spermine/spermidine synthase domain-containing protein n=1 Tax=Methylomonas sp. CM2 TaxID=3417647 RepID=UPI003CE681DC